MEGKLNKREQVSSPVWQNYCVIVFLRYVNIYNLCASTEWSNSKTLYLTLWLVIKNSENGTGQYQYQPCPLHTYNDPNSDRWRLNTEHDHLLLVWHHIWGSPDWLVIKHESRVSDVFNQTPTAATWLAKCRSNVWERTFSSKMDDSAFLEYPSFKTCSYECTECLIGCVCGCFVYYCATGWLERTMVKGWAHPRYSLLYNLALI